MKDFIKQLLREHFDTDDSRWMYEDGLDKQKGMFIHDAYEALTGHFGVIGDPIISNKVNTILSRIFTEAINKKYEHGIIVLKDSGDYKNYMVVLGDIFNTGDIEIIHGLIERIFNGE